MGRASGAPKCKTCGVEEFRHICAGYPAPQVITATYRVKTPVAALLAISPKKSPVKSPKKQAKTTGRRAPSTAPSVTEVSEAPQPHSVNRRSDDGLKPEPPQPSSKPTSPKRKAYLAERSKEWRVAKKLGLTVKAYRIQQVAKIGSIPPEISPSPATA